MQLKRKQTGENKFTMHITVHAKRRNTKTSKITGKVCRSCKLIKQQVRTEIIQQAKLKEGEREKKKKKKKKSYEK